MKADSNLSSSPDPIPPKPLPEKNGASDYTTTWRTTHEETSFTPNRPFIPVPGFRLRPESLQPGPDQTRRHDPRQLGSENRFRTGPRTDGLCGIRR